MQGRQDHHGGQSDAKHGLHAEVGELEQHRLVHPHVLHGVIQTDAEARPYPAEEAAGHKHMALAHLVEAREAPAQHMEGATACKDDGKAGEQGKAEALLR